MKNKIKEYWNNRAKEFKLLPEATTNDVYLRKLEISMLTKTLHKLNLPRKTRILDVGCGDGFSTLKLAERFPLFEFIGMDYSENMIKSACNRLKLKTKPVKNISFELGSVVELKKGTKYDIILSDRCLINLASFSQQKIALKEVARCLNSGGYYIAIENFVNENKNLNNLRHAFGLSEIPIRWHNSFFHEGEFLIIAKNLFDDIKFVDFLSSYYVITRVVYSKLCQIFNKTLDYSHWIHRVASLLPSFGRYCPVRMVIARKSDCKL